MAMKIAKNNELLYNEGLSNMDQKDSKKVEELEKIINEYQKEQKKLFSKITHYKCFIIMLILLGIILIAGIYHYQEYRWNQKIQDIFIQLKGKQ